MKITIESVYNHRGDETLFIQFFDDNGKTRGIRYISVYDTIESIKSVVRALWEMIR